MKNKNKDKNRRKHSLTHYIACLLGICIVIRVLLITCCDLLLNYNGSYAVAEIYNYESMRRPSVKGHYEFSVNGSWYRGSTTNLSDKKLKNRIPYDTITVIYLPSNPEINRSKNAVESDLFVIMINKLMSGFNF